MSQQIRIHAIVQGQVQGVSYRAFTQRRAQSLQLTGWVRNQRDGSVEMEIQGPADQVNLLLESAKQGPEHARVTALNSHPVDIIAGESGFDITG